MTSLLYLNDSKLFDSVAKILSVKHRPVENDYDVVLDQTIFYPQGGGQPSDTGNIIANNNIFHVQKALLDSDGIVHHYGTFEGDIFETENKAELHIDIQKREDHTKLHSAGHLINDALIELHIHNLVPRKGHHFPDEAYVEFEGIVENNESLQDALQQTLNTLIQENHTTEIHNLSYEEAQKRNIFAPPGKSARTVKLKHFECGCGGTHIQSTQEIGKMTITKIKAKKGKTKISYTVS